MCMSVSMYIPAAKTDNLACCFLIIQQTLTINALQISPSPVCSKGAGLQAIYLLRTEPQQQQKHQRDQESHQKQHWYDYHFLFIHTDLWGSRSHVGKEYEWDFWNCSLQLWWHSYLMVMMPLFYLIDMVYSPQNVSPVLHSEYAELEVAAILCRDRMWI